MLAGNWNTDSQVTDTIPSSGVRGSICLPSRLSDRYYVARQLWLQIENIAGMYIRPRRKGVLLDFGCGDQPYRQFLEPSVLQYIGADSALNDHRDVEIREDGTVPIVDESVDFVLSTQVLEHTPDPYRYLDECNRVLKVGGLLILSTHGVWPYHPHPTDYWRWTAEGLKYVVNKEGFSIDYFEGILNLPATGLHLFQDGIANYIRKRHVLRHFERPFAASTQMVIALVDKHILPKSRIRDASVFVVVAVKMNHAQLQLGHVVLEGKGQL